MSFPLWYLLVPFVAALFFSGLFLFFNIFHILRYGASGVSTRGVAVAYAIGYVVVLVASLSLLGQYSWTTSVAFQDILPFAGSSGSAFGL